MKVISQFFGEGSLTSSWQSADEYMLPVYGFRNATAFVLSVEVFVVRYRHRVSRKKGFRQKNVEPDKADGFRSVFELNNIIGVLCITYSQARRPRAVCHCSCLWYVL